MELIDKSALIAEIGSKFQKYWKRGEESDTLQDGNAKYWGGVLSCLNEIKTLIDTLEVKEVDFEEKLKCYCNDYYNCDYPKQLEEGTCSDVMQHIVSAARHFFELGMQVSNKAQKGD